MSEQWEYRVIEVRTIDANGIMQIISPLGEEGWELVSVNPPLYHFKRAKRNAEPEQPEQDEVYGLREG